MPRHTYEYADIHVIYGFCNGNARQAVIEYRRGFPNRRIPDRSVFERVHHHLRENVNFKNILNIGRPHVDAGSVEAVLEQVENNRHVSICEISRITEILKLE